MRDSLGRFTKQTIHGQGIFDSSKTTKEEGKPYIKWRQMLERCYSEAYKRKEQSYKHCYVCDEWKFYSNFKQWFNSHYIEGFELDKDLLGDGVLYSPETCCFIPKHINLAIPKKKTRGKFFTGVRFNGTSYVCQTMGISGKVEHLGSYKTYEEAINVYLNHKSEYIRYLSDVYKNVLDERVYKKLSNFDCKQFISRMSENYMETVS